MVGSGAPDDEDEDGREEEHGERDPPNVDLLIISLGDAFVEMKWYSQTIG